MAPLKKSDQIAVYDDGVGTSSFKPLALLGGAFGVGLKRNVLGLYIYLCRNYCSREDYHELEKQSAIKENRHPKPLEDFNDDEILLFGFSRGAFTVRVLAALVLTQGLVRYGSEADLGTRARAAYRAYRFNRYPNNTIEGLFRPLRSKAATQTHNPNERPVIGIKFIGVWDTVAAYGSPLEEITLGFSKYIWPLELPNQQLNGKIYRARQALAIDEERTTFAPVLWDELDEPMATSTKDEVATFSRSSMLRALLRRLRFALRHPRQAHAANEAVACGTVGRIVAPLAGNVTIAACAETRIEHKPRFPHSTGLVQLPKPRQRGRKWETRSRIISVYVEASAKPDDCFRIGIELHLWRDRPIPSTDGHGYRESPVARCRSFLQR